MKRPGDNVPAGGARRGTDDSVPRPGRGLVSGEAGDVVPEIQSYDDDQIAQWDVDDQLDERERSRILEAVLGRT